MGKSRLAVEAARRLEPEFPDGIWLVDFARAGDADGVVRLLAHAVDARGSDPLARVSSRLREADALVVLDACEHFLDEAARISSTLVADCSRVRILATSREALRVAGEVRLPVAPLGAAAVDLFLERARSARLGFESDDDAAILAAEIVRRVDGLPLAIELAAARVNVLGLAEIVSILDRRAALLRDSPASDPNRTALQELVEWSYDLLHADEKTLLHQLAVHRGGASLASLVAVAATHGFNEATVAYLVSALVDKSIVSTAFADGVARYEMLDAVREYVLERLDESGGLPTTRERMRTISRRWPTLHTRATPAGVAGVDEAARAGARQPLGCRDLCPRRARSGPRRPTRRGPRVVLRHRRARLGGTSVHRTPRSALLRTRLSRSASNCWPTSAISRPKRTISRPQSRPASAASRSPRRVDAPWQTAMVQLALAFAYDRTGPHRACCRPRRRSPPRIRRAGRPTGAAASSALTGALGALARGDLPTATALTADSRSPSRRLRLVAVPAALLEAALAERRGDTEAAAAAYRRALERSERAGFADHASFALTGLGSIALATAISREAERVPAAGPGRAEAAHAHLGGRSRARPACAHRRGGRRRGRRRDGCIATSSSGARTQRPHQAREACSSRSPAARPRQHCSGSRLAELAATPLRGRLAGARPRAHLSWQQRGRAWQSVGIGGPEPSCCQRTDEEEARNEHNHDRGSACRGSPPDRPAAGARAAGRRRGRSRIQRHLDALRSRRRHPSAAAARRAPDEVEAKLGQLKTRLAVAENSLAADVSDDWTTFAAAVEGELRSWDAYLERLQTSVAAKAWKAREQAEAAIGDVRTRRIAVDERLAQARERRRQRRLARAEERSQRGSRRPRTEGRRAVGEIEVKGAET